MGLTIRVGERLPERGQRLTTFMQAEPLGEVEGLEAPDY